MLTTSAAHAQPGAPRGALAAPEAARDVDFGQNLGAQVPLDAAFRDDLGQAVTLADYTGRKPIVLVMAYYECPRLCTVVLSELTNTLQHVALTPGEDFEIVVVSIDPTEKPKLAASKKRNYLNLYGRGETAKGWHFLTGEEPQIRRVADAIGFRYAYDAPTKQYIHPAGIVMLTSSGGVSRYLYGSAFRPLDLKLGLADASQGTIGSPAIKVLQLCYLYDPMSGRYGFAIRRALQAGGVLTVLGLAGMLTFLSYRQKRLAASAAALAALAAPAAYAPPPIHAGHDSSRVSHESSEARA